MITVVTGSTGEAGRAACSALQAAGHTVVAIGSDAARLVSVDASARVVCDLSDPRATGELAGRVRDAAGAPDALIHLVGGWRGGHELDDWNWLEPRVLTTLRLTTLALVDDLTASPTGRLVTVGTTANPSWGGANYTVLKAAASAWVSAVASGWRKAGTGAAVELLVKSIGGDGTPVPTLAAKVVALMAPEASELNGSRLDLTA